MVSPLTYDLQWKYKAMSYFLFQLEKRKKWTCFEEDPPLQEGISIIEQEENGKKIKYRRRDGTVLERWQNEGIFYAEAYISTAISFFDILAKALTKDYSYETIYFKRWIDELYYDKTLQTDSFVRVLKEFKDKYLYPLSEIRNDITHNETIARSIPSFYKLSMKKGEPIQQKFLIYNLKGKEIEILSYLKEYHKEFETVLAEINKNLHREFEYI